MPIPLPPLTKGVVRLPPKRERRPKRFEFTGPDGTVWRVHDVREADDGQRRRAAPGAGDALTRVFVSPGAMRRRYDFTPDESRVPDDDALRRQLGESVVSAFRMR